MRRHVINRQRIQSILLSACRWSGNIGLTVVFRLLENQDAFTLSQV